MDRGLGVEAYADALAAVAIVDQLDPRQLLALFLEQRRSWILQRLGNSSSASLVSLVFCDVVRIIQVSLAQVGELFLQVLNDLPLFYKTILGSPSGTQLFGGVSNPDEEVRLWKLHRERLESVMVMLEPGFIAQTCLSWLKKCSEKIVGKSCGRFLINAVGSGEEIASVERMIRESLDGREALEGSLEWLRSVFGHEIQSALWNQIGQLVLKDGKDLWDEIFEDAFVQRIKELVDLGFEELSKAVNVRHSIRAIVAGPDEQNDFQAYMKRPSTGGRVWFSESNYRKISPVSGFKTMKDENDFSSCVDLYFGPEVSQIREAMDSRFQIILNDLLCFLESPKSSSRLKELAPYLQDKCYTSISTVLEELEDELRHLSTDLGNRNEKNSSEQPTTIVERALLIGRLLFALQNHSSHIPLILGSPRMWLKTEMRTLLFGRTQSLSKQSMVGSEFDPPMPDSPRRRVLDMSRRQTSATAALFAVEDKVNPKLDKLSKMFRALGIKDHRLWIKWVSDELDDALSATTLMRGWEETVVKQEQSNEGPLEIKIALPSMPSLYITSFLFQACQEIHRIGGHVLDKVVLQNFVWNLLDKVLGIYGDFISSLEDRVPQVSEKGVLQVLLDLRFAVDILSGGEDSSFSGTDLSLKETTKRFSSKPSQRRKQDQIHLSSAAHEELVMGLIHSLSQRLDPIDWATYEPYLWENEKQSYQRYAVLYGFLVQLNRMYMDIVQKLPSNTESNVLRCSIVPRFKYLL
ncbi:hypothetical protein MRB53_035336 [Persea americana]|uniref:Uncharacterized protein n=1 Tax=Persea americana TaxID=3435 RepID=A0ACC2K4E9_PERAE|nr:hypothetical protein MRB53_035336 [Persea americana]